MTCYFRHLQDIFKKAGVTVTSENRKEVDRIIHSIVGIEYKSCPDAWREVKKRIVDNETEFVSRLEEAWKNRRQP